MRCVAFVLLLGATLAGCGGEPGPKRVTASGTVTLDGAPLENGRIAFISPEGFPDGGEIKGGKFSLNVTPGSKRVEITASKTTTKEVEGKKGVTESEPLVPAKYFGPKSELKAEISADKGNDGLKFDLSTK